MTKARDTANLVATGVPNSLITLDAAEIPNISTDKLTSGTLANARVADLPTSKITSGTFADARISASSVTAHVTQTDLTPVRQDVLTLALKQAVQENSTKFNLPNSAITKFEADADFNLAGSTDVGRNASEYISSSAEVTAGADAGGTLTDFTTANSDFSHGSYSYRGTGNEMGYTYSYNWSYFSKTLLLTGDFRTGFTGTTHTATSNTGTANEYWQWFVTNRTVADITNTSPWGYNINSNPTTPMIGIATGGYGNDIRIVKKLASGTASDTWDVLTTIAGSEWDASDEMSLARSGSNLYFQIEGVTKYTFLDADFLTSANLSMVNGFSRGNAGSNASFNDCFYRSGMTAVKGLTSIVANATGTALGTTNVPSSAITDVSGVMLMKNAFGTNTLGTDVKVYFTANNSNWTEVTSYADAGTFSTGIKMIKLGKKTCTSGSDVRWKIVWANQAAASKEGHIYGIGLNY